MTEARRVDEDVKHQIEQLILSESDPRERARLLILLQLNNSLVDNVVAVRELTDEFKHHRKEFEAHVEQEMKFISYGRGAMWGVIAMLAVLQIMAGYIFSEHMADFKEVEKLSGETSEVVKVHQEHHRMEEKKFDEILSRMKK